MKIAERRAALGKGPVYLYYFRWETPVDGGRLKSPHTIEIPFAFDNVQAAKRLTGGGPEAMALADKVSDTWIAFAKTGNPNQPKMPRWSAFNAAERPTMVFNTESRLVNDPIKEQRLVMFQALGYSESHSTLGPVLNVPVPSWCVAGALGLLNSRELRTLEARPSRTDILPHAGRVHSTRRRAVAVRGDGLSTSRCRSTRGLSPLGAIGSAAASPRAARRLRALGRSRSRP